jgi:hypothetical protein
MVAMKEPSGAAYAVGRFAGWEPLGFEAKDNNWYRFVANGPTQNTDHSGLRASKPCCPSRKDCEEVIARIQKAIANMVQMSSDGTENTIDDVAKRAKVWADAGGYRSEGLANEPCFLQQAVEDVESSTIITITSGIVWTGEWIGSSWVPGFNRGWDTGDGDIYLRMEAWRLGMLAKRVSVLCRGARQVSH